MDQGRGCTALRSPKSRRSLMGRGARNAQRREQDWLAKEATSPGKQCEAEGDIDLSQILG